MRIHRNAKTTPAARAALVYRVLHEDWTYAETAAAFAVSERTVAKWVHRFRVGGAAALADASSRPGPAPQVSIGRIRHPQLTEDPLSDPSCSHNSIMGARWHGSRVRGAVRGRLAQG